MKKAKLVRDNIPEIMRQAGKTPIVSIADKTQFYSLLKNKLQEEVLEFLESDEKEELADILEVIHALCEVKQVAMSDLETIRLEKRKARGAFSKRLILEDTQP